MAIWHRAVVLLVVASAAAPAAQSQPDIMTRLADRCVDVRRVAVQHTTSINGRPNAAAIAQLLELLKSDPFPAVRENAVASLGSVKPLEPFVSPLIAALDDPSPEVASRAAGVLGFFVNDPRSAPRLVELSEDPNYRVRSAAQAGLTDLIRRGIVTDETITRRLIAALTRELRDPSYEGRELRMAAIDKIAKIQHPDTVPALIAMMQDPSDARRRVWPGVRTSKDLRLVGPLITVMQSAAPGQEPARLLDQIEAAAALGRMKNSGAVAPLGEVLRKQDLDQKVVAAIVTALGDIGSTSAEPYVRPLLTNPSQTVRDAAAAALPKLVDNTPPRTIPAAELRIPSVTELFGPPLKLVPDYRYTLFIYEIPESYHGFLAIDYDTPGCPPLREIDGRTLIRFDKTGHACTSTGFRESSRKAPSLAYRVGGRGRVAIEIDTELSEYVFAPLPPTDRLPSRTTWRAAMFAGTKAELRAAGGCTP